MIRLNEHAYAPNLIMGYVDANVEHYQKIREIVCLRLNVTNDVFLLSRQRIFYMHPLVDRISQAPIVIFLEAHVESARQENAVACSALSVPDSTLYTEGVKSATADPEPLITIARDTILKQYFLNKRVSDHVKVTGWDHYEELDVTYDKEASKACAKMPEGNALYREIDAITARYIRANQVLARDAQRLGPTLWALQGFVRRNEFLVHTLKYAVLQAYNRKTVGKAFFIMGMMHAHFMDYGSETWKDEILKSIKAVQAFLRRCPCIVLYPEVLNDDAMIKMTGGKPTG